MTARPIAAMGALALVAVTGCSSGSAARARSADHSTAPNSSLAVGGAGTATGGATAVRATISPGTKPSPTRPMQQATGPKQPPTGPGLSSTGPNQRTAPSAPVGAAHVPVRGLTIALNPGHNGGNAANEGQISQLVPSGFGQHRACDTTGTETDAGYPEHAFNWDVTLRVRTILRASGVHVILTRSDDLGVGPCIDARADIANAPEVAAVVSIHADAAPADGHGFHICEDSRAPAGPAIAGRSHTLTTTLHDALRRESGLTTSTYLGTDGYFPRSDLAGLNLATVPATFVELGNMRNVGDAARQSSPAGRARMAAALARGILDWLGQR